MRFTIIIPPKGQKRARACVRGGFASTYKDKSQRQEEQNLSALLYEHKPAVPMEGAVYMVIKAYLPIASSKPKRWQDAAIVGAIRPTVKPDADNLAKQVLDVMNGVFFADDRQIVSLVVEKHYGNPARWEIELNESENMDQKQANSTKL